MWYHGGGWVIGNVRTHDAICRHLCVQAGCVVVSVDYRLAPEHKYPAAADDCYAATVWASANAGGLNGDASQLAVGGDSAGGNLSAVVSLMARDKSGPDIVHQLMVYPVTEFRVDTASYMENADGYLLTRDGMIWFWGHYLGNEGDGAESYASPMRASDLSGLPTALVITAEFDPLRDEGEEYAQRLTQAGIPTTCTRYDGMVHGFFGMPDLLDKGAQAIAEASAALRDAFAG
jgi:acetyl esterase